MSTLQELEKQLAALSLGEKAQVLQWVARDVSGVFPGIESTPGVCGGEPRIVRTRSPSGFWNARVSWVVARRTCCVRIRHCGLRIS